MSIRRIEQIIFGLTVGWIILIFFLGGCIARGQEVVRISPAQPIIPAMSQPIHTFETNNGQVYKVTHFKVYREVQKPPPTNGMVTYTAPVAYNAPKNDMPPPLPVNGNAPHHYYGIIEFKKTREGRETENELHYFGLFPTDEAFRKSQGVGNTKFTKRFKAVFRYPSQLPLDATCVWQRSDGMGP